MLRTKPIFATTLLLPAFLILTGCAKSTTQSASPQKTEQTKEGQADASRDHADSTAQSSKDAEITAALAKLTAEDRTLATKQKTCPVSGELLGTMGATIKIDVKGQPVFICCEGCKEQLLSKADEYLAKLKNEPTAK